jgi:putative ABC transport system permease protein
VTIHTDSPAGDLSRLRIDRDAAPRRPWLALVGGFIGRLLALPWHGLSAGAINMTSFSELAFKFRITPALLLNGLIFSAVMGAVGGLLPALRAARIPVARALREI